MSQSLIDVRPDVRPLVTEDGTPMDDLPSEKRQRLLTGPLYSWWTGLGKGRPFLAAANVGIFYMARSTAIVSDVLLSLDCVERLCFSNSQAPFVGRLCLRRSNPSIHHHLPPTSPRPAAHPVAKPLFGVV